MRQVDIMLPFFENSLGTQVRLHLLCAFQSMLVLLERGVCWPFRKSLSPKGPRPEQWVPSYGFADLLDCDY